MFWRAEPIHQFCLHIQNSHQDAADKNDLLISQWSTYVSDKSHACSNKGIAKTDLKKKKWALYCDANLMKKCLQPGLHFLCLSDQLSRVNLILLIRRLQHLDLCHLPVGMKDPYSLSVYIYNFIYFFWEARYLPVSCELEVCTCRLLVVFQIKAPRQRSSKPALCF